MWTEEELRKVREAAKLIASGQRSIFATVEDLAIRLGGPPNFRTYDAVRSALWRERQRLDMEPVKV